MIYILEGPEAAGKSTLAKTLSEATGFDIVHRSYPKTKKEQEQMFEMYKTAIAEEDNVIYDRCWYSEMVYGGLMRDKSYISQTQMWWLESMLKEKGAIIIHCTDTAPKLWARCQERGEDYVTSQETLRSIKHSFERLMHKIPHNIPVLRYELSKSVPVL